MFRICLKWIWTIQFAAMLVHANRCLSSTNNRMYNCIKHIKIHWFFSSAFRCFFPSFPYKFGNELMWHYVFEYKMRIYMYKEREGKKPKFWIRIDAQIAGFCVCCFCCGNHRKLPFNFRPILIGTSTDKCPIASVCAIFFLFDLFALIMWTCKVLPYFPCDDHDMVFYI